MTRPMRQTRQVGRATSSSYTMREMVQPIQWTVVGESGGGFHLVQTAQTSLLEQRRGNALAAWEELAPSLSRETREFAQSFVDLCEECGAFLCQPGCHIDLVDDDQIMFDWNTGKLPVFTVLITDGPRVAHVGRFRDGKETGERSTLDSVTGPLMLFVKEAGPTTWPTIASRDSSLNVGSARVARARVPVYIRRRGAASSLSSLQTTHHSVTYMTPGAMLRAG